MEINIWRGILISFATISIWKLIRFQFRDRSKKFSFNFWLRDNWADYPINIGIAAIFFVFENDAIKAINQLLAYFKTNWVVPDPENKGFLFVLIPCIVLLVFYPMFRKFLSKPIQNMVNTLATTDPTKEGGGKT